MFCGCASGSREHNCGADAFRERTALLHQIHGAMSRFVGQLQHMIETMTRIRDFLLGQVDQSRIDAEAIQCTLQIARQLL